MQFGKIHGVALIVLGLFLLGMQVIFYMSPTSGGPVSAESPGQRIERKTNPLPGIVGVISLFAGVAIFATRRKLDEPQTKHAVK
jgi:hypothetical protein